MRVLLDANILISYLLTPNPESPVIKIVDLGLLGGFQLLVPEELLDELVKKARAAKYLAGRIAPEELQELVDILGGVAETIPRITEEIPAVTRDPKDDYLLAYAVVGEADYLVTGDHDLLVLGQVDNMRVVTPHELWQVLQAR